MNRPPAACNAQGGRDLGHLHEGEDPFVHPRPAARTRDDDQRQLLRVASSMARVSFSPTTDPIEPMMKLLSVMPKTIRIPLMKPWPTSAASLNPVRSCSALIRSG